MSRNRSRIVQEWHNFYFIFNHTTFQNRKLEWTKFGWLSRIHVALYRNRPDSSSYSLLVNIVRASSRSHNSFSSCTYSPYIVLVGHVTCDVCWDTHPPCEQNQTCKNITFPQLCLRAVIIAFLIHLWSWRPHLGEILDPPLVNIGQGHVSNCKLPLVIVIMFVLPFKLRDLQQNFAGARMGWGGGAIISLTLYINIKE